MPEFNNAGNADLRAYLTSPDGWSHVALVDADGNEETRIDIHNDSRASWGDPTTNPVTLTIEIAGTDADIDTPVELSESALFAGDTATDALHDDDLRDANGDVANVIVGGNDTLTVEHTVELPEVTE